MCDPVSIAGLAFAAVSTAAQMRQGQLAAGHQADAINKSTAVNNAALTERERQINASAGDQVSARARQAMIERGHLEAASGESGLGDNTGRVMLESYFNQSNDVANIEANRSNQIKQTEFQKAGATAQAEGAYNTIQRPSLVGSGLQIAGAGVTAADRSGYFSSTPKPAGFTSNSGYTGSTYTGGH